MKSKSNIQPKWKIYILTILTLVGIQGAASCLSVLVSYPTAEHRLVSQQLDKLGNKAFSLDEDAQKVFESKEYKDLSSRPETNYTTWALGLTTAAQFVIFIVVVFGLYRYLRKSHVTDRVIGVTVLLYTVASAIATIPTWWFNQWFTGSEINDIVLITLMIGAPFAVVFSVLVTFLVAKIAEWHYGRSHGFVAE